MNIFTFLEFDLHTAHLFQSDTVHEHGFFQLNSNQVKSRKKKPYNRMSMSFGL